MSIVAGIKRLIGYSKSNSNALTLRDNQPKFTKHTLQPQGFWKIVHRILSVDHTRSTGIPLNSQYRTPAPAALDPNSYDDSVTLPAADLADNPYWKRDMRRAYPTPSVVKPSDVVALLTLGSKAEPREDVLQIGESGKKQLIQVQQQGEEKGLATFFKEQSSLASLVLDPDGLPPQPTAVNGPEVKKYTLTELSYPERYQTRNFV